MTEQGRIVSIQRRAQRMRYDIIDMISSAGSGHPGGSLSAADVVATLYFGVMRHDPADPMWPGRDRFVLSKGHAAPVLYAALAEAGYFERDHLASLRRLGSMLQGHPDRKKCAGVEVSTGSLGQGLAVANGMALGLKLNDNPAQVFCLLGDGELQEGAVWEAAMFAPHYGLDNVTAIVDHNGLQIDGACDSVMCLRDVAEKFSAFGWEVRRADGHDVAELLDALETPPVERRRPVAVIAHTIKGKGVSFMEGDPSWHGKAPSPEQTAIALAEIGSSLTALEKKPAELKATVPTGEGSAR